MFAGDGIARGQPASLTYSDSQSSSAIVDYSKHLLHASFLLSSVAAVDPQSVTKAAVVKLKRKATLSSCSRPDEPYKQLHHRTMPKCDRSSRRMDNREVQQVVRKETRSLLMRHRRIREGLNASTGAGAFVWRKLSNPEPIEHYLLLREIVGDRPFIRDQGTVCIR